MKTSPPHIITLDAAARLASRASAGLGRLSIRLSISLSAMALAACSALPTINPDMAVTRGGVRIEDARGHTLSPARSRAVLEKLAASGRESNALERHLALEEALTDSPLSVGNRVVLLQNGPATYSAMFAAIDAARDHINMETYILEADETGLKFADALLRKAKEGVHVNLIRDSVGTLSTPGAFFKRLQDGGVKVLEFNPVNPAKAKAGWDVNQRDHRKLLVVDGQVAFLGGINISAVYSGGSASHSHPVKGADGKDLPWRDTDVQLQGPVVADLQKMFLDTWERQHGVPLDTSTFYPPTLPEGDEVVRAIASGPDDPFSQMYATLISAIDNAETEICLTNAYFVPDPQLVTSLIGAVKRGVDVKVVLPSKTDSSLVFNAGRWHYEQLLRGGVKIYERQDVLLHSKTVVIDGVWSTVGSTNLDWRSFLHNQEINAVVLGAEFGRRMKAAFDKDLAASKPVTLDAWEHRSSALRMKEWFSHLWEYWL